MRLTKNLKSVLFLNFLLFLPALIHSAEILMIFNSISKSHHILGEALGIALADNGHKVDIFLQFFKF